MDWGIPTREIELTGKRRFVNTKGKNSTAKQVSQSYASVKIFGKNSDRFTACLVDTT
jgi:hypothetical protein